VRWFERAIEADPNFARPRALWVCARSGYPGWTWEDLQARTQKALELDPNDPEGNRVMGSILLYTGQIEASRRYHEKANALSPSDAYIKSRTASFFVFTGEPDKALALLDEAEALDPFLPVWCVEERVAALYSLGRYTEAIDAAQGLTFQTRRSRLYTAACLVALGRKDDARRVIADALVSAPDLDANFVPQTELYTDNDVKRLLMERVTEAGLPRFHPAAVAS
jgi:tetratricopeptide (TPR) repeat protein